MWSRSVSNDASKVMAWLRELLGEQEEHLKRALAEMVKEKDEEKDKEKDKNGRRMRVTVGTEKRTEVCRREHWTNSRHAVAGFGRLERKRAVVYVSTVHLSCWGVTLNLCYFIFVVVCKWQAVFDGLFVTYHINNTTKNKGNGIVIPSRHILIHIRSITHTGSLIGDGSSHCQMSHPTQLLNMDGDSHPAPSALMPSHGASNPLC